MLPCGIDRPGRSGSHGGSHRELEASNSDLDPCAWLAAPVAAAHEADRPQARIDPSPPRRLRVGVVGAGLIAQVMHLHYLRELADRYEVSVLCDIAPANAAASAERFGVPKTFTDWREMLREPMDAVLVLTAGSHAPIAIEAARAGLHVLVEKPMCFSTQEAQAMIDAAETMPASRSWSRTTSATTRRFCVSRTSSPPRSTLGSCGSRHSSHRSSPTWRTTRWRRSRSARGRPCARCRRIRPEHHGRDRRRGRLPPEDLSFGAARYARP